MSFIFKKLSVLFCCLFCLVSLNSVVSANTGDYLVYFLGKDENNVLECGGCGKSLRLRSGQFCCLNHCHLCAIYNVPGSMTDGCKCGVSDAYPWLQEFGSFCFIKYENGGDVDTVFQNAKKSNQLHCAYCMAKLLNGNFDGKISFNIPEIFKTESGAEFELHKTFKLDALSDFNEQENNCRCSGNLFVKGIGQSIEQAINFFASK